MKIFESPFGQYRLSRFPHPKSAPLQAWSAADEILLNQLNEQTTPDRNSRILIINDTFGALTIALHRFRPTIWSDSYLSKLAIEENFRQNDISTKQFQFIPSTQAPTKCFDIVLIKLPKTLSLLEYQLIALRPWLKENTLVIGASMVKYLQQGAIDLFERFMGTTRTSLAKKKARLIFPLLEAKTVTVPDYKPMKYALAETGIPLVSHANVFAREKLDIGTRFFLAHIPSGKGNDTIVDLGCGNGALGIYAAAQNCNAELCFIDESWLAIKSARESFELNGLGNKARFITGNALDSLDRKADLILCNPPFHQENTITTQIANMMFRQASRSLTTRGEIRVIGNRHLAYHKLLRRYFRNVSIVASNSKFVILKGQQV